MKFIITQTVEIDPQAWAAAMDIDVKNVREDVEAYFAGYCQQEVELLGLESKPVDTFARIARIYDNA